MEPKPELTEKQHGPLLMYWGSKDEAIAAESPNRIGDCFKSAGKPFTNVFFSEGKHGFFCDDVESYDPQAAKLSWMMTQGFLAENMIVVSNKHLNSN